MALRDGLESIGAGVADVRGVLVTHMHFDHVGLAGRVRQASGAWIAMHPADREVFARPDYRSAERAVAVESEFDTSPGASPTEPRPRRHRGGSGRSSPRSHCPTGCSRTGSWPTYRAGSCAPCTRPVTRPGTCVSWTSGRGRLFSGDHVLPRITPNISVQRGAPPDPLGDYLDSLARTRRPRRGRGAARARVAVPGSARPGRRHRGPPRAAARRTAGRDPPAARLRPPGCWPGSWTWSRPWDQYSAPDADLRGHRDRRARAPAGAVARRGDREPDSRPPAYTARAS